MLSRLMKEKMNIISLNWYMNYFKMGVTLMILPYLVKGAWVHPFGWITFALLLRRCSIKQNIQRKTKDKSILKS